MVTRSLEEAEAAVVSVFLFFVPFQIPKRTRQHSREINSIRLEKAKLPHQHGLRTINADLEGRISTNCRQGLEFVVVPEHASSESLPVLLIAL